MDRFFNQIDKAMDEMTRSFFGDFGSSQFGPPRRMSPRDEMLRENHDSCSIIPRDESHSDSVSPFSYFGRSYPFNSRRDIVLDDYPTDSLSSLHPPLFGGIFDSMNHFQGLENQPGVQSWSHSYSKSHILGPGEQEKMVEHRRQRNPDGTIVEAYVDRKNGKEKGRFVKKLPTGEEDAHEYEADYPYMNGTIMDTGQRPLPIEGSDDSTKESKGRWWRRGN